MLEAIVTFTCLSLFGACLFSPWGGRMLALLKLEPAKEETHHFSSPSIGGQSYRGNFSFVAHLQSEIEAELCPRPSCSILQRHHDALVAAEVNRRLAMMTE